MAEENKQNIEQTPGEALYQAMLDESIEDPQTNTQYFYTSKHPLSMMYPKEMSYQLDRSDMSQEVVVNSAAQAIALEKAMHLGDIMLASEILQAKDGFEANRTMIPYREALEDAEWEAVEEAKVGRVVNAKLKDPAFREAAYLAYQDGVEFAEANGREQTWGAGMSMLEVEQAIERGKEVEMAGENKLGDGFHRYGENIAQREAQQAQVQAQEVEDRGAQVTQEFIQENLGRKQSLQEQLEGLNPGTEILVHPVSEEGTEYVTAIEEYPEPVQDTDFEYVLRSEVNDLEIGDAFVGELDDDTALVYVVAAENAEELELALEGERIHELLMDALEREYELAYEKIGVRLDAKDIDVEEAQERLTKKHGIEDPQGQVEAEVKEAEAHFDYDPAAEAQLVHDAELRAMEETLPPEQREELSVYDIDGRMLADAKREAAVREHAKEGIEGPSL